MFKSNNSDLAIFILRLTAGGLMLVHGIPKMMKFFGPGPIMFADPIGVGMTLSLGLAVFAEVICAAAIVIGLKTRLATIPAAATMFVAVFIVHAEDPWGTKEKALIYLMMYIVIFISGSGKFSIDNKLKR